MVISPVVRRMVAFASAAAKVTVPPGAVQLTIERKLPAPLSLLVVTEPHGLCGATAAGAARTGVALKPGVRTNAAIITSGNATRRRMGQLLPASMTAADGRADYVANRKKKKEKKIKGEVVYCSSWRYVYDRSKRPRRGHHCPRSGGFHARHRALQPGARLAAAARYPARRRHPVSLAQRAHLPRHRA